MTKKDKRILGINPGTRYLGIAVFHGSELMDWRIKTFKGKWTKEKAYRILESISEQIDLYDINTISFKKLHPSRSSKNLKLLVLKLKIWAKRNKIKVYQFSIKEIENYFISDNKLNKQNLIEALIDRYPILYHDLDKEKNLRNSYYFRMFVAVALASARAQGFG